MTIVAAGTVVLSACGSDDDVDLDDGIDVTVPDVDVTGPDVTDPGVGGIETAPDLTMPDATDAGG